MNTVYKRIAIVAGCIFCVGLLLGIAGFVLGGANSVLFENGRFRVMGSADKEEIDYVDETFENVKDIIIDVDYFSKVILKEGTTFSVKGSNPKSLGGLEAKNTSGTLTVSDSKKRGHLIMDFGFFNNWNLVGDGVLEITYPANANLGKLEVNVNLGDVEISDLNANKIFTDLDAGDISVARISTEQLSIILDLGNCDIDDANAKNSEISCDSGNINIKNFESDGIEVDSSLGDVTIDGSLRGKSDIDLDAGDLKLNLKQSMDDTAYFIETDLGDIVINGDKRRGLVENRIMGAQHNLNLKTDLGNVSLNFY